MFSLTSLTTYATKWQETNRENLNEIAGFNEIESAMVTEREMDWGISSSICLFMKGGGQKFIPLSKNSELKDGDNVDLDSIEVITLEREGDDPIFRADGDKKTSRGSRRK